MPSTKRVSKKQVSAAQLDEALRCLHMVKSEVHRFQRMTSAAGQQALENVLTNLAPFAADVAAYEGHGDVQLVLERELDL